MCFTVRIGGKNFAGSDALPHMRHILLIALLFLCGLAWSDYPAPSAAKSGGSKQPHADQSNDGAPSQQLPVVIVNTISPNAAKESGTTERYQCCEESSSKWILEAISALASLALVIITGFLVRFTKKLWESTHGMLTAAAEQSRTMEESNAESAKSATAITRVADSMATNVEFLRQAIATNREIAARQKLTTAMQLRPYVSPTGIVSVYTPVTGSNFFSWMIRVVWTNYGSTPTRRLSICTTAQIRETILPETFNFPYDEGHITRGVLLPHIPLNSAHVPKEVQITVEDIEAIQAGRKFLYVWGWAKYHDAFEDTPEHVTKFCWIIEIVGNPRNFVPHSGDYTKQLEFRYAMLRFGNCSDEECDS